MTPTVVLNPDKESPLMQDEIFGPILPVYSYQTFDEVIKMINEKDKPLVVYYFGKSCCGGNYKRLEKETSSGSLVVNETIFHVGNPDLPFGGVGFSGYGRYHGFEGFKAFSNAKSILLKPVLNFYPYTNVYPPWTQEKQKLIKFFMT